MKKGFSLWIGLLILTSLILSACQGLPGRPTGADPGGTQGDPVSQAEPTATLTALPTARPQPTATPVPQDEGEPETLAAEEAVSAYFVALEKGDTQAAAEWVSSFSLMVFEMTRSDAVAELQRQKAAGADWSGLGISESQLFDQQTALVHVNYTLQTKEEEAARNEVWPVRLENGVWRVNWKQLIDFRTLTVDPQTTNGVTVLPVEMQRFSDRVRLEMLMQNRTGEPVVFGQVNEVLATFHFGEEDVVAEDTQIILNPLRSKPDVALEIKGLFEGYPDAVTIRKWKSYDVEPWYEFDLTR